MSNLKGSSGRGRPKVRQNVRDRDDVAKKGVSIGYF